MKTKNIKKIYTFFAALMLGGLFLTSCNNDKEYNPSVTAIVSEDVDLDLNTGKPGDKVRIEGNDLTDISTITFRALLATDEAIVNVIFNPVLNSDLALYFEVPFDDTKGSEFGIQEVAITNKQGKVVTSEFNILQPEPLIAKNGFDPERPKVGTTVKISGQWFQNLISVQFAGADVEYTQISNTEITMYVPFVTESADVTIKTLAGEVSKYIDIDLGYTVYKYFDYDGSGAFPVNDWWSNGDITDPVVFSDADGIDGLYAQITWSGSTSNGWGNTEPSAGSKPGITETDQSKVFFVFDVFCVSEAGSSMQIQIDDGITTWAHDYTFSADEIGKWINVKMSAYDFGAGYDPTNQTHDMDIQGINKVKVAINGWTGIVPTTIRIDNLQFHGYY